MNIPYRMVYAGFVSKLLPIVWRTNQNAHPSSPAAQNDDLSLDPNCITNDERAKEKRESAGGVQRRV